MGPSAMGGKEDGTADSDITKEEEKEEKEEDRTVTGTKKWIRSARDEKGRQQAGLIITYYTASRITYARMYAVMKQTFA